MRQYLFFTDFPLMEKGFYFYAERAEMKEALIAYQEISEGDIYSIKLNNKDKAEIKKYSKSSAQLILKDIKKNQIYKGYEGKEEKLFFHYHNLLEISIVVSGEGYYFAEGRAIKVQAGSIVVFNSLVPHAWIANKENKPILRTFIFYQNLFLENELEREEWQVLNHYLKLFTIWDLHGEEAQKSFAILELIYEEFKGKKKGYRKCIKQLLLTFFIYMVRTDKNTLQNTQTKDKHVELDTAIKYMKSNFHNNITLEDVAKEVYMHPNYFSAVFKKKYRKSFVEYMSILKISMATELMESTDLSIEEIAIKCGFTSISNFYRVFKNVQGITPVKYIKQISR